MLSCPRSGFLGCLRFTPFSVGSFDGADTAPDDGLGGSAHRRVGRCDVGGARVVLRGDGYRPGDAQHHPGISLLC